MQSLPDGFETNESASNTKRENVEQLFSGDPIVSSKSRIREKSVSNNGRSSGTPLLMPVVACLSLASLLVIGFAATVGKDSVREFYGVGDPKIVTSLSEKITQASSQVDQLFANFESRLSVLTRNLSAVDESVQSVRKQVDTLSKTVELNNQKQAALEEKVNKLLKQREAVRATAAPVQKKPKPVAAVGLVSIRTVASTPWVKLSEGLDTSPLLTVGDSWREWQLVAADPIQRKAVFVVQGKTQELSL